MSEKIIGYLLLTAGLIIIGFSAFSAFFLFTKSSQPVKFLNLPSVSLDINQLLAGSLPAELRGQLPKNQGSPTELFPSSALNFTLNLTLHLLLLGFFVTLGYKISQLGVQLLRPINVQLKN